jgi:hypothetical protein
MAKPRFDIFHSMFTFLLALSRDSSRLVVDHPMRSEGRLRTLKDDPAPDEEDDAIELTKPFIAGAKLSTNMPHDIKLSPEAMLM